MNLRTDLSMHTLWDDILKVFLRRKRLVLATAAILSVLVYLGLSFVGDKYEARASLLVTLGLANAEVPLTVEKGTVHSDGVNKEEINSYISLLRSRPMLAATIDRLGVERLLEQPPPPPGLLARAKHELKQLARWGKNQLNWLLVKAGLRADLDDRELLILLFERHLVVENEKDTHVITLSLRMADPYLASEILQILIDIYLERHVAVVQQGRIAVDAIADQVAEDRSDLAALREATLALRKELNIGNLEEQRAQLVRQVGLLDDSIRQAERQRDRLAAERTALTVQIDEQDEQRLSSVTLTPSSDSKMARERLAELNLQRAQGAARFVDGSIELQMIDDEINDIRRQHARTLSMEEGARVMERNPVLDVLETRLASVRLDLQSIETELRTSLRQRDSLAEDLQTLNEAENKLRTLELETSVAENRFVKSATRSEEAKAQGILNSRRVANISILSEPSFSWKPVAPRRLLVMLGGILGGLALGFGLALFLEWQSQVIHDEEGLKQIAGNRFLGSMKLGH